MEQELISTSDKAVAIIGAGPAGCMCAKILTDANIDVSLFDKGKFLRTILPTGGGRCNLAHAIYDFKELAKNSVGYHDDNTDLLISTYVSLYNYFNDKIIPIDIQISTIVKELNPSILTIPGIGEITAASIIAEYGDISCFSSSDH